MRRNNFLTLVLAMFLALGSMMAIAQVTVNAPDKLIKRGGNKTAPKEAPAASAPATAPSAEAAPASPASPSAGTATAPKPAPATATRRAGTGKKKAVGQAPSNYTARGASYMPSRTAGAATDPNAGTAVDPSKQQSQITGFRVQVLFSSDKKAREKARNRAKEVALRYPSYKCYISYVAPQWRLRFGDFKYRADANTAMQRFCRAFPQFRKDIIVVVDKINVR